MNILWLRPDKPDNISVGRHRIGIELERRGHVVDIQNTTATKFRTVLDDDPDAIVGTTRLGAFVGTWKRFVSGTPLVIDHIDPISQLRRSHGPVTTWGVNQAEKIAFRLADHVMVVYDEELPRVQRYASNVTHTTLGVDYDRFSDPSTETVQAAHEVMTEHIPDDGRVLLYVGGLEPPYHVPTVVNAMAHLDGWHLIVLGSQHIDAYVGTEITAALLLLVLSGIVFTFTTAVLKGEKLVHVAAILQPVERIARTALQLGAVVLTGLALFGLLYGHVAALVLTSLLGLYLVSSRPARPTREDFENVLSFAKYSWLGGLSTRTFNAIDTVILGFFVGTTLIGIYEIAWNVASVLAIFSSSVSHTVFPELSDLSADDHTAQAKSILNDALAFTGLFIIPGLVGAVILGEYILALYGAEFRDGYLVLIVLIVARLLAAYQRQFVNALGAFDRPDLAFRVNLVFVVTNVTLNVVLVWQYGWAGAAVATALSAGLGLVLGYAAVEAVIGVAIPYRAIGRQVIAALVMGVVVALGTVPVSLSVPIALAFVAAGSVVYFVVLLGISARLRTTVVENIPISILR